MTIKALLEKVKSGEELTAEEEEIVSKVDEKEEAEEEEKMVEKLAVKLLEKIEGSKAVVTDEKAITKENMEKLTGKEREEAFFKALVSNDHVALKYLGTGTPANGGYLVPQETNSEVLNFLGEESVMRSNAYVKMNCPAYFEVNQFATLPTAYFRNEAAVKTASAPTFGQQALTPYSVAVVVPLTNEIRRDANVDIASEVTGAMKESLLQKEEEVFAAGTGTGQPTGLETYYASYAATRKITASDYAALEDRLTAASTRLAKRYRAAAKWYMSTEQLEIVRLLKDGNDRPLFQDDLTGEFAGRIFGKPVEVNDHFTNIWFGDLKGYWIGQSGGVSVAMSEDATIVEGQTTYNLFQMNMFAIRVEEAIDGELVNSRAIIAIEAGVAAS